MATGFAGKTKTESDERRMRYFFGDFYPDPDFMALFVASELPTGKWLLPMDRTYWEFGKIKISILVLAVTYKGIAIPPLWKFLTGKNDPACGKKGNSDTDERKEPTEWSVRLFGKDRPEAFVADREFIGNTWFLWLKANNSPYAQTFISCNF